MRGLLWMMCRLFRIARTFLLIAGRLVAKFRRFPFFVFLRSTHSSRSSFRLPFSPIRITRQSNRRTNTDSRFDRFEDGTILRARGE